MIRSMTGYGKAEANLENGKLTVEIRSLNGKTADISVKSSLLPKDMEIEIRKYLASELIRGNIDLFITYEPNSGSSARALNTIAVEDYFKKASELCKTLGVNASNEGILRSVLRFPDVFDQPKNDVINEGNKDLVQKAIIEAVAALNEFRAKEGCVLYDDITAKVESIYAAVDEVEQLEGERVETVRTKIMSRFQELSIEPDPDRLEAEMIYYIEKFDINEEKTRLRQHCRYFMETIDNELNPGKKLGFIAQEMGREINTTGSKANHTGIQKIVVRMKDELEKIKEQSLNVL